MAETRDDNSVSVSSSDHMWGWGGPHSLNLAFQLGHHTGFNVSPLWVSVMERRERRLQTGKETHSLEHSSIIYFLFLKNHHSFSSWKFINFQQHSFEKCKVTIQIFNRKKKNKLTVELFFFSFCNSTFFFYNTFNVLLLLNGNDEMDLHALLSGREVLY